MVFAVVDQRTPISQALWMMLLMTNLPEIDPVKTYFDLEA